jgi:hypothetical protein
MRFSGLLATFILLFAVPAAAENFPRPASLEPQVRFWRDVFGSWSRYHVVLHDTVDLDKVYAVLDFSSSSELGPIALDAYMRDVTENEMARLRRTFAKLDAGGDPQDLTPDERRIFDLYKADTGRR